jgi:hypothetical protein
VRKDIAKSLPLWSNAQLGRKTVIYVKNLKKRRRLDIIKCCGRKRCSDGPKRSNETIIRRKKPGAVTSVIKGKPEVKGGTTAAPGKNVPGGAPVEETDGPGDPAATSAPGADPKATAGDTAGHFNFIILDSRKHKISIWILKDCNLASLKNK